MRQDYPILQAALAVTKEAAPPQFHHQRSRILVKNLPKYLVEERLKEFFSRKGQVTDAKLMRTKEGKSKQFGFVGFRSEEEAHDAINFFNNSYFDTCRITCEIARKIGDQDLPRPWSKYSLKTREKLTDKEKDVNDKKGLSVAGPKEQQKKSKINGEIDDPLLPEFLEVMKPHSTSKLWANDTIPAASLEKSNITSNNNFKTRIGEDKSNVKDAKSSDVYDEEGDLLLRSNKEKPQSAAHDTGVSDVDYFKSRIKEKWSDSDSDEDEDNGSQNDDNDSLDGDSESECDEVRDVRSEWKHDFSSVETKRPSKETVDKLSGAAARLPSSKNDMNGHDKIVRLFIRNLPYTTTEEELEEHFSKFGDISEVHIVVDKETKRSKGIGYIRFSFPESTKRALEELDNSIFQGRLLHVMPAIEKTSEKQEMNALVNGASKSFKRQREEERKEAETSGNTQAWNPFYMRPDTVVENIARKFGMSKSDFLDNEAEDLAVRTALGETHVIAETKKALAKVGVNITSLEKFAALKSNDFKRSNHVILVKNLPYGSSEIELAVMFGRFGCLDKIILPSTKTLALIIFLEPSEARAAFNGLRYKRYKDGPLYLEWAPSDILAEDETSNRTIVGEDEVNRVRLEQEVEGLMDPYIDHDSNESMSLYVKNLNFKTSAESLKKHFSELIKGGKILSVRVLKGFGFIEFDSVGAAVTICRDLQGTVLDGHALILQICHANKEGKTTKKVESDKSPTKLIIRNVAFEATKKELRDMFCKYGQIKSLRLPKKVDNQHKGFAFVEYVTKQEAQYALQQVSHTHFRGRPLVVEHAKEAECLEELRARTKAQFSEACSGLLNSARMLKKRKKLGGFDEDHRSDFNRGESRGRQKQSSNRGKRMKRK